MGAGAYPDLQTAGHSMVRLATTVEPEAGLHATYDEGYARYLETYAALAPLFHRT